MAPLEGPSRDEMLVLVFEWVLRRGVQPVFYIEWRRLD